jgi:hypothetical protein
MTNILDIHRTGGRRREPQARRRGEPRPRWTAPETASEADGSVTVRAAPAFRRLVVFGSVDATARRPVA